MNTRRFNAWTKNGVLGFDPASLAQLLYRTRMGMQKAGAGGHGKADLEITEVSSSDFDMKKFKEYRDRAARIPDADRAVSSHDGKWSGVPRRSRAGD